MRACNEQIKYENKRKKKKWKSDENPAIMWTIDLPKMTHSKLMLFTKHRIRISYFIYLFILRVLSDRVATDRTGSPKLTPPPLSLPLCFIFFCTKSEYWHGIWLKRSMDAWTKRTWSSKWTLYSRGSRATCVLTLFNLGNALVFRHQIISNEVAYVTLTMFAHSIIFILVSNGLWSASAMNSQMDAITWHASNRNFSRADWLY